jgi:chemotaxis protein CheX
MNADILNAFLRATANIGAREAQVSVRRTGLALDPTDQVTDEVTVYVALVGQARGLTLLGMSTLTARQIAGAMIGEPQIELNEMGLSALAELGNLIAGGATIELEKLGVQTDITPPTIMIGQRARLSTLALPRFVIPLDSPFGPLHLHVAVDIIR